MGNAFGIVGLIGRNCTKFLGQLCNGVSPFFSCMLDETVISLVLFEISLSPAQSI